VSALGDIGAFKIISESSIGSNIRRVEAITGFGSIARLRADEATLDAAAGLLGVSPDEVVDAVERRIAETKELRSELRELKRKAAGATAAELAGTVDDGVVVARLDGHDADGLRQVALLVRERPGIDAVVLIGTPDGTSVSLVAAADTSAGRNAGELLADAAKLVKGGGGRNPDVAVAGGKDPSAIDDAIAAARRAAGLG
jgi:alanyl-tRNA synthetase